MLAQENLFRCVLYPRGIDNNVMAAESIFRLSKKKDDEKCYETSIALSTLFNDEIGRHGYGDRTATAANDFQKEIGKLSDESQCHYIAHYEFSFGDIYKSTYPYYTICVFSSKEKGLDEHFALEMRPNSKVATNRTLRHDRTCFLSDLVKISRGPFKKPNLPSNLSEIELAQLGNT